MSEQQPGSPPITFRPIVESDMAAMKRWLEDPDVSAWYQEGTTDIAGLREQYRDELAGTSPTRAYIIGIHHQDAGYIQGYVIDEDPEYAHQLQVEPGAVGIDLYLGEPWARDRGYGAPVLRAFLEQIVFGTMNAEMAIIAPAPANVRAVRSYEKAGFVGIKTVYVHTEGEPHNTGDEYVMQLSRDAFTCGRYSTRGSPGEPADP